MICKLSKIRFKISKIIKIKGKKFFQKSVQHLQSNLLMII